MENTVLKYNLFLSLFLTAVLLLTCSTPPEKLGGIGKPGFRIRSDFSAMLNSDQGWAGALNENMTIYADHPIRIRFEIEQAEEPGDGRQFRLQYRRNNGNWTDVEAHDFPHP
jgi:hypothetical protein